MPELQQNMKALTVIHLCVSLAFPMEVYVMCATICVLVCL